jgi:Protein of unknown function (DUF3237)
VGRIDGSRLNGAFLPGSVEWVLLGTDGISRLEVRGAIRTDDDALIYYETRGAVWLTVSDQQRLAKGERVPFDKSYFRTTPKLETSG